MQIEPALPMDGNFKMQSRSGDVDGSSISSNGLVATCCLACTFSLAPLCRLAKARAAAACDRGLCTQRQWWTLLVRQNTHTMLFQRACPGWFSSCQATIGSRDGKTLTFGPNAKCWCGNSTRHGHDTFSLAAACEPASEPHSVFGLCGPDHIY